MKKKFNNYAFIAKINWNVKKEPIRTGPHRGLLIVTTSLVLQISV